MVKYIKEDWPEYQEFMERPDFRERCFYCADDNSYFIPENLYDEVMEERMLPIEQDVEN